jgi:hypothetical protein
MARTWVRVGALVILVGLLAAVITPVIAALG